MVKEVRLYVEGGGDQASIKTAFRHGLGEFLKPLRELARSKRIRWEIVVGGGRKATFDAFRNAVKARPSAFNILLVDSEGPITLGDSPWDYLKIRDGWDKPAGVDERHCHLMVQTMEAWLLADPEKLKEFYGKGFNESALPGNQNVEQIAKPRLVPILESASKGTKPGTYHKTRHGPKLLERVRLSEVRQRAAFCNRLVEILEAELGGSI